MKRVFVCSPLRGDIEKNIEQARELCAEAVRRGYASFAPHVFYTQFLDDSIEEERNTGMKAGFAFLEACDEIWVYTKNGISEGMQKEIDFCKEKQIDIRFDPWDE